jgi:hypothetical protein
VVKVPLDEAGNLTKRRWPKGIDLLIRVRSKMQMMWKVREFGVMWSAIVSKAARRIGTLVVEAVGGPYRMLLSAIGPEVDVKR